jgi:RNA polymerase sigma factor (sigma-70 family)
MTVAPECEFLLFATAVAAAVSNYNEHRGMSADRGLVEAALADEPGAFERLVRQHQRLCWHIIYRIVDNRQDAEDLCQETFLRVHRYLHQYRYESALNTWIGQIAYSVALRHMERRRVPIVERGEDDSDVSIVENMADCTDLEALVFNDDVVRHVRDSLESLPPLQRSFISLYHLEGLSIAEISRITGLAHGTIKSHLFRARLRLRTVLNVSLRGRK